MKSLGNKMMQICTIWQKLEQDHNSEVTPRMVRIKKVIPVEDGSDYWEREKMQPLEKVQENDIGRNKVDPKEQGRVNVY